MTIWFTSDWHLAHGNIIEYCERPFDTVEQMDNEILKNTKAFVRPDDTLYLLGDIIWKDNEHYREMIKSIDCHRVLISGNHDASWRFHKKGAKVAEKWVNEGVFEEVLERKLIEIEGQSVLLCHFPYSTDSRHDTKYSAHLPDDKGAWLFHGHVHQHWTYKSPRQLNVGVDVWNYFPISWEYASEAMFNWEEKGKK